MGYENIRKGSRCQCIDDTDRLYRFKDPTPQIRQHASIIAHMSPNASRYGNHVSASRDRFSSHEFIRSFDNTRFSILNRDDLDRQSTIFGCLFNIPRAGGFPSTVREDRTWVLLTI